MHQIKTALFALAALSLAFLGNGCGTYQVGNQCFTSRAAAEQEHTRQLNETLSGINPTASPVGGRALFVLPTLDDIEQHGIKFTGNRAAISRDQIEYIKQTEMNAREFMMTALQARQIFASVTLVHNNDPAATPFSDYDFLIYLHQPSPDETQWYLKAKGSRKAQPIVMDMGKPIGAPRTLSWLDSVEALAHAEDSHSDVSAITDVRLSPAPREKVAVAVAELRALALSATEVATLSERLRNTLTETGFFKVLSSPDMEAVLKAQEFQRSALCDDTQCLVEMGKILSVQYMVGGSIGKVGRMFSISLRLIDVESGAVKATASFDIIGEPEEMLKAIRSAGRTLVKNYSENK